MDLCNNQINDDCGQLISLILNGNTNLEYINIERNLIGSNGMKATYANHYLVNGTTFPDVLLFDNTVISNGDKAVKCAGFFGNDWSIETGDFKWN